MPNLNHIRFEHIRYDMAPGFSGYHEFPLRSPEKKWTVAIIENGFLCRIGPPIRMARRRKEFVLGSASNGMSARIRSSSSRAGMKLVKPVQRNAANARERARMRVLSKAFSRLKTTLPWVPADTKLSKLDTLRLASSYIAHLRDMLHDNDSDDLHPVVQRASNNANLPLHQFHQTAVHPLNLVSHGPTRISLNILSSQLCTCYMHKAITLIFGGHLGLPSTFT